MQSGELRRIDAGPVPGEAVDGFLVHVAVGTPRPPETLCRVRDVLRVVLSYLGTSSGEDWARLLPAWFVSACSPELTPAEAEAALARWRADPVAHDADPWSLSGWLYWFEPENRSWWWWDGQIEGDDRLGITIVVEGHPFADGALRWLLLAAGAASVAIDD